MRVVIFTHSLVSDWNHANAHFLRGFATELVERGNDVRVFEPRDGWSRQNLLADSPHAVADFERVYPRIRSSLYDLESLDLDRALDGAGAVIVHEWNSHELVRRIGEHRAHRGGYSLYFHDTHHRSITDPDSMAAYDLQHYDGVLARGGVIRDQYRERRWTSHAWTWHEAADTRVFRRRTAPVNEGDLVWIGNWGDEERTEELREFLIGPIRRLRLKATIYGIRYPDHALRELAEGDIRYGGWLPNYRTPETFARYRVTIHVPRRSYARSLPGIPTIRPFEALACGIPMISAPWQDSEELFRPGRDFLFASSGEEMISHLDLVLNDPHVGGMLAESGMETIRSRHTCGHRVNQLLAIIAGSGSRGANKGVQ